MKKEIPEEIKQWAFWLSSGLLGEEKLPLCPWAKRSILEGSVDFWENHNPLDLVPLPPGIKVRIVSLPNSNWEDLISIRDEGNRLNKDWVFLESHPEDFQTIGGIKSVFKSPLMLIQSRRELKEAREILKKGNYYFYWDDDVLKSILGL